MFERRLTDDRRGQFVTLGGIMLAVLIISGVYIGYMGVTSYEDRRGGVSQATDAARPSGELSDMFSASLTQINHDPDISSISARETEVQTTVSDLEQAYQQQRGVDTEYVDVSVRNIQTNGYRIVQTDPTANFSVKSGGSYYSDWTAFSGATDARQVALNIDPLSLPDGSGTTPTIVIETQSETKELDLYLDTKLRIEDSGGEVCAVSVDPSENVSVDLLRGVVDSKPCHDYRVDSPVERVSIRNGGLVEGTFSMTRRGGSAGGRVTMQSAPPVYGAADSAVQTNVVYSAVLDVTTVRDGHGVTKPVYIAPGSIQEAP